MRSHRPPCEATDQSVIGRIRRLLKRQPGRAFSRTEITNELGRNVQSDVITETLEALREQGEVERERRKPAAGIGGPVELWKWEHSGTKERKNELSRQDPQQKSGNGYWEADSGRTKEVERNEKSGDVGPNGHSRCYSCKGTDFWYLPGSMMPMCRVCHPPVHEEASA
jgi:hypothetical protein